MSIMGSKAHKVGLTLLAIHFALFLITLLYISSSSDGQAPLVWVFFAIGDLPVSLIYMLGSTRLSDAIYMPYLIHGVLGPAWWYLLPRLFMTKQNGGIWGASE